MDKDSVQKYVASIPFDRRLWAEDIAGSIAHAEMLGRQGIIEKAEADLIIKGLGAIRQEIEQGKFEFKLDLEDIHFNIEAALFGKIGDVAGKLHTARSRNDQIALDLRLFVKKAIRDTLAGLEALEKALVEAASKNKSVIMPGYTHLQKAQPVLLAHHLLAYFEMLERDKGRFEDCLERTDVLPLGSGALAGVPYPVDRQFVAEKLGFARVSQNSMDSVSDRDFVIEFEAAAAVAMMHLSRLAEELVLWSSAEFGFVTLSDAYTTGSSIMPQKKNPDIAELARGKTGRVYGHLVAMLTTMKGLPLTYNRDLQEDKEGLFDTVDTVQATLEVLAGMTATMTVNASRMEEAAGGGYLLATDLADYLVAKGVPFRRAHGIVARLVRYAQSKGKNLSQLTPAEYRKFSALFGKDVYGISAASSVSARHSPGGTAPGEVAKALRRARRTVGL